MTSSLCVVAVLRASLCEANKLISPSSCPSLMTLCNISFLCLQALGFPGDDLTAVPWQRPRCNEGPFLLLFSQLPAPLPILQHLCCAVLPVCRDRLLAGLVAVRAFTLQTSALLPADGATSHCQHAAAEAQLTLPEPRRCFCRTPRNWWRSTGLRGFASGYRKPASRSVGGPRWRRDGRGHQYGKPELRDRWNY